MPDTSSFRNLLRLRNVQMLGDVQGHQKSGECKLPKCNSFVVILLKDKQNPISNWLSVDIFTKSVILVRCLTLHSPDLLYHCLVSLISQPSRGQCLGDGLWFPFPPSQSETPHLVPAKQSRSCMQLLQEVWWEK